MATTNKQDEPPRGTTSMFLSKLGSFWMVQSMEDLYSSSKERNSLLTAGLQVLERGVNMASNPVRKVVTSLVDTCPEKASSIDTFACSCLEKMETKYPVVQEQAGHAVQTAQHALSSGLRKALRSYPGRQLVRGLDVVITASETVLDRLTPLDHSRIPAQQPPLSRDIRAQLAEAEEDRGTDEVDKRSTEMGTQTCTVPGFVSRVVTPPLTLWVQVLRHLRKLLIRACGLRHKGLSKEILGVTPTKKVEIGHRRKVSPRKRLGRRSMLQRLTGAAFRLVGIRLYSPVPWIKMASLDEDGEALNEGESPGKSEKRKHGDISDESSQDELSDDDVKLDDLLQTYHSADDSDYQPMLDDDRCSTDSMEYHSGDTESDVETEQTGEEGKKGPHLQIKPQEQQAAEAKLSNDADEKNDPPVPIDSPPAETDQEPPPADTDTNTEPTTADNHQDPSDVIESSVDVIESSVDVTPGSPERSSTPDDLTTFPENVQDVPEHLRTPDKGQQSDPGQSSPTHSPGSPKFEHQPGWKTN